MKKLSLFASIILAFAPGILCATSESIDFPVIGFTGIVKEAADFTLPWDPDWFTHDATTYNHNLARIACILSTNAYQDVDAKNYTDVLSRCYLLLGAEKRSIEYHYNINYNDPYWGNDQCAFSFAHTKIKTAEGTKTLVFAVIRGTPLNANEWISNLKVTASDKPEIIHDGFLKASQQIITAFYAYLLEQRLSIHDCCFLLTGHSRGAAVSNLLASMLIENRLFTAENLYVYTFACPNVTTEDRAKEPMYNFIWNIVNAEDIVPTVPLARDLWKFKKFGHILTFVHNWNSDRAIYEGEVLPKINTYFQRMHMRDYTPFKLGPFVPIQVTRFLTSFNSTVEKYNGSILGLRKMGQKIMWKVFPPKDKKKKGTTIADEFASSENEADTENQTEKKPALVTWLDNMTDGLIDYLMRAANDMHAPETYLSYVMALDEDDLYSDLETNEVVISGATECAVFSQSGEMLLRCRDSHVEYTSISLPIAGYQISNSSFCIGYPVTENYTIVLYRSSIIPTPVTVKVERYTPDGKLIKVCQKNKTYLHKGIVKVFKAGLITSNNDSITCLKLKGDDARTFIKNSQISRLWKFKIGVEGTMDTDYVFSSGITFGSQALYGGALLNHNFHHSGSSLQLSMGIGTQQILWDRIMINFEAYNHFVQSLVNIKEIKDSSGSFNFVPCARFTLSYKHRKRIELFGGMSFDFHIEDFNDTAFDTKLRDSNLWDINLSDSVDVHPSILFGLRM